MIQTWASDNRTNRTGWQDAGSSRGQKPRCLNKVLSKVKSVYTTCGCDGLLHNNFLALLTKRNLFHHSHSRLQTSFNSVCCPPIYLAKWKAEIEQALAEADFKDVLPNDDEAEDHDLGPGDGGQLGARHARLEPGDHLQLARNRRDILATVYVQLCWVAERS